MKTDKICVHNFILICPHIRKKAHTFTNVKLRTKTYGAYTVYFHLKDPNRPLDPKKEQDPKKLDPQDPKGRCETYGTPGQMEHSNTP